MSSMVGTVRIRGSCVGLLRDNLGRISVLFPATLQEQQRKREELDDDEDNNKEVVFEVHIQVPADERTLSGDLTARLQKYVDDICGEGCAGAAAQGEDSSYDSDYEVDPPTKHQDVSRTTSDTLAAEYAEYVQTTPDSIPGYTARVEFALKLGYTEKLVQAALQKLGPAPAQNELLAELIKLGAHKGGGTSCDSSPTENPLDGVDVLGSVLEHHQLHHQHHHHQSGGNYQNALRPIVIDGSNVAMGHGNKEVFSCRGIKICVDWFKARGHREITVFVPKWRKEAPRPDNPVQDQEILTELEKERLLVFTPSRLVAGKRTVCYDDRYILKLAIENEGIVVSNDNYRDLCQETAEYRRVVEERLLMYSFVNDRFMPPEDPLGRTGPTLDNFLRYQTKKGTVGGGGGTGGGGGGGGLGADGAPPPPPCPYGKKCTYGNKCKYHHPERGPFPHKSVTERLSEHAQRHLQAREGDIRKIPLGRTRSNVPPPKETPQHTIVSKSRSVDNVGTTYQTPPPPPLENLHRKLQRQLTLNPTSDPRLINQQLRQRQQQQQQQQQHYATGPSPSLPQAYAPVPSHQTWEMHQHVTRIASAPDSYRPWPPGSTAPAGLSATNQQQQQQQQHHRHMQRISSCSDPQLNVWPPMWSQGLGSGAAPPPLSLQEDARRKLHYHLAAIFPEEQVTQAMQMFPDETNPQKICAAILSMFPKT